MLVSTVLLMLWRIHGWAGCSRPVNVGESGLGQRAVGQASLIYFSEEQFPFTRTPLHAWPPNRCVQSTLFTVDTRVCMTFCPRLTVCPPEAES